MSWLIENVSGYTGEESHSFPIRTNTRLERMYYQNLSQSKAQSAKIAPARNKPPEIPQAPFGMVT
jgi:hypothetical protein